MQLKGSEKTARLFNIKYQDECDFENYLQVTEDDKLSEKEIEEIEFEKLEEHCSCLMSVSAIEITEINGYKIKLEKEVN